MSTQKNGKLLQGKDLISIGIFSAIYFVLNFICMLLSGLHPVIWILMPALIALVTGIPFLLMCAKVQKFGAVLLMGMVTGLLYFVTGQFTVILLGTFLAACLLGELIRFLGGYKSFLWNAAAFAAFSLGMTGSPLPIWIMRESFLTQISEQGMAESYVSTLRALSSQGMLVVMIVAPVITAFVGASDAVEFGTIHARTVSFFFFLLAYAHCVSGVLRGCGKAIVPMITMLICWCGIRILYVTLALKVAPQFQTISWAYPLTWGLSVIALTVFMVRVDWRKMAGELK